MLNLGAAMLSRDALTHSNNREPEVIRVIVYPTYHTGTLIELILATENLRQEIVFGLMRSVPLGSDFDL